VIFNAYQSRIWQEYIIDQTIEYSLGHFSRYCIYYEQTSIDLIMPVTFVILFNSMILMQNHSLYVIIRFFMQRSLVKSVSLFQPSCVRLNPHDRQRHCEKQIPYDIHGKSTLLLGHLGACM
jgi:hypothetical protein